MISIHPTNTKVLNATIKKSTRGPSYRILVVLVMDWLLEFWEMIWLLLASTLILNDLKKITSFF